MRGQVTSAMTYGAAGSGIDVGFGASEVTPLAFINRLVRFMEENNVPTENRWLVGPPLFWEQMADESSKLVGVDFTGDGESILRNGRVSDGMIRGFKCYRSNNMPTSSSTYWVMAGHMSSTATASQIAKTEVVRSESSFSDIVRGLHLYGRKTLRTNALAVGWFTVD